VTQTEPDGDPEGETRGWNRIRTAANDGDPDGDAVTQRRLRRRSGRRHDGEPDGDRR
jgi:hypothetical protein